MALRPDDKKKKRPLGPDTEDVKMGLIEEQARIASEHRAAVEEIASGDPARMARGYAALRGAKDAEIDRAVTAYNDPFDDRPTVAAKDIRQAVQDFRAREDALEQTDGFDAASSAPYRVSDYDRDRLTPAEVGALEGLSQREYYDLANEYAQGASPEELQETDVERGIAKVAQERQAQAQARQASQPERAALDGMDSYPTVNASAGPAEAPPARVYTLDSLKDLGNRIARNDAQRQEFRDAMGHLDADPRPKTLPEWESQITGNAPVKDAARMRIITGTAREAEQVARGYAYQDGVDQLFEGLKSRGETLRQWNDTLDPRGNPASPVDQRSETEAQGEHPKLTTAQIATTWRDIAGKNRDIKYVHDRMDNVEIQYQDGSKIKDDGSRITLDGKMTPEKAEAIIAAAKQHGWQSVRLTGDKQAKEMLAAAAVKAGGLKVSNPEMAAYVKEQEARQGHKAQEGQTAGISSAPQRASSTPVQRMRDRILDTKQRWANDPESLGYYQYHPIMDAYKAAMTGNSSQATREQAKASLMASADMAMKSPRVMMKMEEQYVNLKEVKKWSDECQKVERQAAADDQKQGRSATQSSGKEYPDHLKSIPDFQQALDGYNASLTDSNSSALVRESLRNSVYERAQAIVSDPQAMGLARQAGVDGEADKNAKAADTADQAQDHQSEGPSFR